MAKKVVALIDGFNLYHSIDESPELKGFKWVDLWALVERYVPKKTEALSSVYYFTALAQWDPGKMKRHKTYIRALKHRGVEIVYGKFKRVTKKCRQCKKRYITFEEKETDVNIALYLLNLAIDDKYDKAILFSADSDLSPAIRSVQARFPSKEIVIGLPPNIPAEGLKQLADGHVRIRKKQLTTSQLPETITLEDKGTIQKPPEWA